MNSRFKSFLHAIKAEWLKGRRTSFRHSPVALALSVAMINYSMVFRDIPNRLVLDIPAQYTNGVPVPRNFAIDALGIFDPWIAPIIPLYCILIAIQNHQSEHTCGMWKHINSQPVPGVAQAMTKHLFSWCQVVAATIMLSVLTVVSILIVKWVYPEAYVSFSSEYFWLPLCQFNIAAISGGMVIVSILNALAARVPAISITAATGSIGTLLLPFVFNNVHPAAPFIPWVFESTWYSSWKFGEPLFAPLWVFVPLVYVVATIAIHLTWQKDRPLY